MTYPHSQWVRVDCEINGKYDTKNQTIYIQPIWISYRMLNYKCFDIKTLYKTNFNIKWR